MVDTPIANFQGENFIDAIRFRSGKLAWRPTLTDELQEVLYYERETPHRKYGVGVLHPFGAQQSNLTPDEAAARATDKMGVEIDPDDSGPDDAPDDSGPVETTDTFDAVDGSDDFEVTSPDVRQPSTMGISFSIRLEPHGRIIVRLPQSKRFAWQSETSAPFLLNGRYEHCERQWTDEENQTKYAPMWRRHPAVRPDTAVVIDRGALRGKEIICHEVLMPENSPIQLRLELFPRQLNTDPDGWLVTIVLRNSTRVRDEKAREALLYQAYFEVGIEGGVFQKYPESQRPFEKLDAEERSLALLHRESATWGIGHGCAAGWDAEPGHPIEMIYADVMPATELPSMTPEISDAGGNPIQLSMRALASLPDSGSGDAWRSLDALVEEYANWIERRRRDVNDLPSYLKPTATEHLEACDSCRARITVGVRLVRSDPLIRKAFKLANLAMLLQQIATKQLKKRPLSWLATMNRVGPAGSYQSPWGIYCEKRESDNLGYWRAFQIGFLLLSIGGASDGKSADREIVDLIWFPTGGGKTEAYLAVISYYMFHQRILMEHESASLPQDGTNVLMRYTLRMLTTQQFQRAASLICAMEFLRRHPQEHGLGSIPGRRFSLGLWIGADGSPNKCDEARKQIASFRSGKIVGNPLVLTECPWCRSEIGRYEGDNPYPRSTGKRRRSTNTSTVPTWSDRDWNLVRTRGVDTDSAEGPLLHCTDSECEFGADSWQSWLPIEVIDERIYNHPPSLVIATADKLAMIAYRPLAGALFGRSIVGEDCKLVRVPPGLIIQDELHLISVRWARCMHYTKASLRGYALKAPRPAGSSRN
jgi:hypothetical protein